MPRALLALLLLASSVCAQVVTTKHEPGFVELVADAVPEGASVTWEARKPYDLFLLDRLNLEGQRVCIMYLQPGSYVVVLDVIDWDNRKRIKKTYALEVEGELPDPNPPSPPSPTPPTPGPDPEPEPNPFDGILGDIHTEARQSPWTDAQVKGLADNYEAVSSAIAAGGLRSIRLAAVRLRELNKELKTTDPWHKMKGLILSYLQSESTPEGTMTLDDYAKHLQLISEALRK